MEEMTSIGDEMRECIRSNDHAGLNDIITSLQTQVAESGELKYNKGRLNISPVCHASLIPFHRFPVDFF